MSNQTIRILPQSPAGAVALRIWACVLSVMLTAVLLLQAVGVVGAPESSISGTRNLASADKYSMAIANKLTGAMGDLSSARKVYWIGDDAMAAPVPNQDCFGYTSEPKDLQEVIDRAALLLEGQDLYFNPDMELVPDSEIAYYLDDTILNISWKLPFNGTVYTFSEVKISHPSQFRRFLSEGEFGSGRLYLTSQMAQSVNAVVASSADYYSYRYPGITVVGGEVKKANPGLSDCCFVDRNGDLLLFTEQSTCTTESVAQIVEDADVNFSISFGPNLIIGGERCEPYTYPIGEISDQFSRAAICQMGKLHYLIVNANAEPGYYVYPDIHDFTDILMQTGCEHAYTLDGGQTATTVVNNQVFNNVNYGSERLISDIIYFATAIPDGG